MRLLLLLFLSHSYRKGCIDHSWPRMDATRTLIHNTLIYHVGDRRRTCMVPMTANENIVGIRGYGSF